jgi:hypothetical protein
VTDIPHWDEAPDVWDTLVLGGDTWPGIARVTVERGRKIDKKSAKGKNKATTTDQGVDPADVTITVRVMSAEDFAALADNVATVEPKAGTSPMVPYDIVHPVAAFRKVTAIVIEKISGPTHPEPSSGQAEVTLKCLEYNAPPVPTGGGPGGGNPAVYTNPDSKDVTSTPDGAIGPGAAGDAAAALNKGPAKTYTK